jgi:hypothetical protein
MTSNPPAYIALAAGVRSQREFARLTLRQAAELAPISNPYLSQIEPVATTVAPARKNNRRRATP